ncbi:NUDIX hydrolase [Clostridium sp. UBA7339]|uniref:NUDIX hydrolase n=1 Tax=Clostridium sp. UBA7339 TaxID=1946376 RepID=UPI0032168488
MRAPIQVLVIPYKLVNEIPLYCIFKRNNGDYWQFIAGGAEDDETPLEAAKRESFEESGIESLNKFYQLVSTFYVPANCISEKCRQYWDKNVFVIPEYCFAVNINNNHIELSLEHTEYFWGTYQEVFKKLYWESNKVALFELNSRIETKLF